jgi:hypothetical protein
VNLDNSTILEVRRAELFLDFIKRRHGDDPKDEPSHG